MAEASLTNINYSELILQFLNRDRRGWSQSPELVDRNATQYRRRTGSGVNGTVPLVAFLDSSVLYPALLRSMLMHLSLADPSVVLLANLRIA